jgi:hypothetical protein
LFPLSDLANPAHRTFWPTKVFNYANEKNASLYWSVVHSLEIEPSFRSIIVAARLTSLVQQNREVECVTSHEVRTRQHMPKNELRQRFAQKEMQGDRFFCKIITHEQY